MVVYRKLLRGSYLWNNLTTTKIRNATSLARLKQNIKKIILSAGQTSATFNALFDATFEKMLHSFDMSLKLSRNIINNIRCVNQKNIFLNMDTNKLCCGSFD